METMYKLRLKNMTIIVLNNLMKRKCKAATA